MSEDKVNKGQLVCWCLHSKFPKLKNTTPLEELPEEYILHMGVAISDTDELGYIDIYSQEDDKKIAIHKEFLKVLRNG